MQTGTIHKPDSTFGNFEKMNICFMNSFIKRLKGLMFTKQINENEGALFINKSENRVDSSIHMLFMNYDIAVFWINNSNVIVDKLIAKKWRLIYYPKVKASKILETHINNYEKIQIGDQVIIESL
ncbi:MAG TPA: DUF192 domain-containing protein [Anaerolineaceae bacterium]|nr:DUF192 domain-containing protein [Anaerolineaceae bacterium]